MKYLLSTILLVCTLFTSGQNVGINQPAPSEKLDVNGNVNITGTIKANGTAGTNGQVLMSTGAGLSWGSLMNYKKCVTFYTPGSSSWTVPAGVKEVMVELWGGGSGGTARCGGTSGGYARTVQAVDPGYVISYTIGAGSSYSVTNTNNGGNTLVTLPAGYIQANGGGGVQSNSTGIPSSGTGFITNNFFYMFGNPGTANNSTFGMKDASTYVEYKRFGSGGAPVGMLNSTPIEGDVIEYDNGATFFFITAVSSAVPSAGGAAGIGSGWNGGHGMIIIWFNN